MADPDRSRLVKRYSFPLEQVRRIRRTDQDRAAVELGRAQREAALAAEVTAHRLATYQDTPRPCGTGDTRRLTADLLTLRLAADALVGARETEAAALGLVEERRVGWTVARGKVKALDSLDERLRVRHAAEADAAEQLEIDDLVSSRHEGAER
jgi:flagellar biosynthesis chaperone FliJ